MIYTVRGPIKKATLGITLSHEHFKWENDEDYANQMYFDRQYNDEDISKSLTHLRPIMADLKGHGCGTIVETSPPIGGQNLKLLHTLSKETDIHIIPSTGWNMSKHIYGILGDNFEKQLGQRWIDDFQKGLDTIDGLTIRPGYIKLLLDRGDLNPVDTAMLEAAFIASEATGMPIHCHILEAKMFYQVFDLIQKKSFDPKKFLWAHACMEGDIKAIQFALHQNVWLGFDNIQAEDYDKYIKLIKTVIDSDGTSQLLLSQDYDFYTESKNGQGQVCSSLLTDFIPYCKTKGISQTLINDVLTINPSNFYDIE